MIKYAVVEFVPFPNLESFVWKEDFTCIKEAERERLKYLEGCELDPQNVKVIQYSA